MIEIRKTEAYTRWLDGLRDIRARARVLARVERSHQEIRAMLARSMSEGGGKSSEELELAVRQIVSRAISSEKFLAKRSIRLRHLLPRCDGWKFLRCTSSGLRSR